MTNFSLKNMISREVFYLCEDKDGNIRKVEDVYQRGGDFSMNTCRDQFSLGTWLIMFYQDEQGPQLYINVIYRMVEIGKVFEVRLWPIKVQLQRKVHVE